ncbi:MAG: thioredoxin [Acidaminococcus sp.]|jgi:thioredoxin 1|nr:thioredoxin [Acidaminococcus sp.]MCI2115966.1 thioredoxin [Acidaminococcus sp.]
MELLYVGSKSEFDKIISTTDHLVIVDFWATWCGPCQMVAPVIEQLSLEHPDVQVAKVDVDQLPDVAQQFGIAAIPTVIYFKGGKEVERYTGVQPKAVYENAIASV